jgi:hypothetical protein
MLGTIFLVRPCEILVVAIVFCTWFQDGFSLYSHNFAGDSQTARLVGLEVGGSVFSV